MASKTVTISLNSHPLSREENGINFDVKDGTNVFGELTVSKGGLRWRPKNTQKDQFCNWRDLDAFMKTKPAK